MNILQTVKYYEPSKGGMETVVKNIISGINELDETINFIVYSNNHFNSFSNQIFEIDKTKIIKQATPFFFKSQPLTFNYKFLAELIDNVDIIHHHYPFPNMEINILRNKKKFYNKKFILTWHANINKSRWSYLKDIYSIPTKKILDMADNIVVTSEQLIYNSSILSNYLKKITIIPLSFSPEFEVSDITKKNYPVNRKFNLLFVGKLRKYKGVIFLLEAIKDLDINLTIVGDGEELKNLETFVENNNISTKVTFIKNINQIDLINIYKKSHLFILPSINEAEAFGVVQLEAMSNGLPVINTKINSGVPFVSIDKHTGLTVSPANPLELKNAIEKIINDPNFYELLSKNSIIHSTKFTRKKMSKDYLNLYRST